MPRSSCTAQLRASASLYDPRASTASSSSPPSSSSVIRYTWARGPPISHVPKVRVGHLTLPWPSAKGTPRAGLRAVNDRRN